MIGKLKSSTILLDFMLSILQSSGSRKGKSTKVKKIKPKMPKKRSKIKTSISNTQNDTIARTQPKKDHPNTSPPLQQKTPIKLKTTALAIHKPTKSSMNQSELSKDKSSLKKQTKHKPLLRKTQTITHKKRQIRKIKHKKKVIPKSSKDEVELPEELKWVQEDPQEHLLSRFVETPKGTMLGESIGIDGSKLILKKKLKFYSIPLNSVKEKGDKLILRRKVNWKKASKMGEHWRKKALGPGKKKK